jgi:hypothetical protein
MYYFRQCYLVHSAIRKQRVGTIPSNPIRPFFIIILALDKELSLIRPYVVKKEVQLHKKGSAMYKKKGLPCSPLFRFNLQTNTPFSFFLDMDLVS